MATTTKLWLSSRWAEYMPAANALATQRLAEFLAVVSASPDPASAVRVATERAARVLEAEVAAMLDDNGVVASVGFAFGRAPVDELLAVVGGQATLAVPGAGLCHTARAPLAGECPGYLVVARSGEDPFSVDEISLLRGMARVLELTVATLKTLDAQRSQAAENNRLLASLRERQRLLEQLSIIQRAITRRAPLQNILDAITAGAKELLRDDVAALHVVDPDDPSMVLLMSSTGLQEDVARRIWRIPVHHAGVAGRAVQLDELVVRDVRTSGAEVVPELAAAEIHAAMAAPVRESGTVVGGLVVASRQPRRQYSPADRDVLSVFAEHVSLALTDAKTQEAMTQAFHDSLTGLASRALFLDRLEHALARAAEECTRVAVLFVDLDRFKNVNDSLGHSAGDELLIGVADRLRACLGEEDTAARLGGDEFAVLCEACDVPDVTEMAQRIIDRLRAPFLIDGHEMFIDASVGISFNTAGAQSAPELIRDADLAMYQAKKNGKGRHEIFRPELRTVFLRNLDLEARLRKAISQGDLVLHYQPMINLADGRIVGVEALVRWQAGPRELVPPGDFIPLAEETGLILAIDRWVLRQACRQGGRWNRDSASPLTISVNLSTRQFQHAGLPDLVSGALLAGGLDPSRLVLEITESQLMHDTDAATDRLYQLKALGVRVAVDDFGTGYSSLAYLRQFPADVIKIDKSFVDGVTDRTGTAGWVGGPVASGTRPGRVDRFGAPGHASGPDGAALARAIVQLGRTLRLTTVAEGVETIEQLDELRAAGCQLAQGYYFAPPLEGDRVTELLTGCSWALSQPN